MRIEEVIAFVERWAPCAAALPHDHTGLQVGDPTAAVKNVLVTLEVTDRVIEEAVENQVNLILTHHPLIFNPLSVLNTATGLGRQIAQLIEHKISVYAAHTNLDAAPQGVSITLAQLLGVIKPRFLTPPATHWLKKIAVFVPESHIEAVRAAMAQVGAGVMGDYDSCSFNLKGWGTFRGSADSSPAIGQKGVLETVEEVRLEMLLPAWNVPAVLRALRAAHPYEEIAYDLYPLDNEDVNFGFGAIGELEQPLSLLEFLQRVKECLGLKTLGVMEGPVERIFRVAVCGGSGGDLLATAWQQGADLFLTGEMKYHKFLEFEDRITVIVAGHYASERVILPVWVRRLQEFLGAAPVSVIETKMLTNPLKYLS